MAAELHDEPDWLAAPPLELPPLVEGGVSRLTGCTSVSAVEWRIAEVLLEQEETFRLLLAGTPYAHVTTASGGKTRPPGSASCSLR